MIRFLRSISVQPGKNVEAMQWAKEVAQHITQHHGSAVQAYTEVFGDSGTLYWVGDYEDVAAVERLLARLPEDQELMSLINRGASSFAVGGTQHDRLLRAVS